MWWDENFADGDPVISEIRSGRKFLPLPSSYPWSISKLTQTCMPAVPSLALHQINFIVSSYIDGAWSVLSRQSSQALHH
jgi:hypothetical protein